jgi:uncharacterized protein YaaW (UPF0174 family)
MHYWELIQEKSQTYGDEVMKATFQGLSFLNDTSDA